MQKKTNKLGGDGAPPRHQLGGPPLNSTSHLTPPRAAEIGAPHGPQTANRGGLWMPPGSRRGWRPSAARTRGGSPYFKANWAGNVPPRVSGGASPYIMVSTFSWGSGDPDCQSWGRCQRPGAVSTVAAGSGPCPGRAAVPREFPHPQARTGGGEAHRPPVIALGPHPMMHLCRDTRCDGMGSRENRSEPWGGLGHRETRSTLAYRHPPVEPALCHRGSPRWPARGEARDPVTQPPRLGWVTPPYCVLAQGTPPWFHPHTTVRSRAPGRQWGFGGTYWEAKY